MNYRALFLPFFILALAYFLSGGAQSSRAATPVTQRAQTFYRDLKLGDFGVDVLTLQKLLNQSGSIVAESGPGSPGNETDRFGAKTKRAVIAFQEKYRDSILTPAGLQSGTGYVGRRTREVLVTMTTLGNIPTPTQQTTQQPPTSEPTQTPTTSNTDILLYYPSAYASTAGKTVTINGQGFTSTGNTLIFSKEGRTIHTITDIASPSGGAISFKVPSLTNDRYTLSLTNSSGASKHDTFIVILDTNNQVPPPKISRITPSDVAYGEPVTLYGENLAATNNMLITNYGIIENATSSPDNTSITFSLKPFEDIPQIKAGTAPKQNLSIPVFVHIVNKNGVSDTKNPGTFTIRL